MPPSSLWRITNDDWIPDGWEVLRDRAASRVVSQMGHSGDFSFCSDKASTQPRVIGILWRTGISFLKIRVSKPRHLPLNLAATIRTICKKWMASHEIHLAVRLLESRILTV